MKTTPLYETYKSYPKVKLTDFGSWSLPLQFSSIGEEHHAVRNGCGLFDISHMGQIMISGPLASEYLDYLMTNSITKMSDGQLMYSFMCNSSGGVVDDVMIYRFNEQQYMVVVNASNSEKDLSWMIKDNPWAQKGKEIAEITDFSPHISVLALQGPKAVDVLSTLDSSLADLSFFTFKGEVLIGGRKIVISRNGYTGEDGFELYMANEDAPYIWNLLLESGKKEGLIPCGLGARDTLRLEAKLPLYGQELDEDITPLEANLGYFVASEKGSFVGKEALVKQKQEGVKRTLRGIEMIDKAIPRHTHRVFLNDKEIGFVTSGTKSPTLGIFCGYVLIDREIPLSFGDTLEIEIYGKRKQARIVKTPFYKR